jgi:solute:Na+ symporter, SSS family
MLTFADKIVIAFYFVFMTLLSWVMKRFIRNTSDYFRGGGEMLWWMAGAGAFMVSFSAVVFTGMAGQVYSEGPVVLFIYIGNAIGFIINIFWFAPISRQTRRVTAMEVVRDRFGRVSEQFFTWLQLPLNTLYAGIWLNGLCVFVAAAFNLPLNTTIIITGAVVLLMALLGGSWSVMAGDFVQMLILMPVTIVASILALIKVGGVRNLVEHVPPKFFHWSQAGSLRLIGLWCAATLLQKFIATNSMQDSSRYLAVKDTKHARRAAMLATALNIFGPILWFLPPMVAAVVYPNIKAQFPKLSNPQEASYFAICMATMPAGMVGLLISGVFGATMSSMDGGLNKNAGFFVKNFYQPYLHPHAAERELLYISKLSTLVLGVLIILAGLMFANWSADSPPADADAASARQAVVVGPTGAAAEARAAPANQPALKKKKTITIFDLMTRFGALVAIPATIPMVLGLMFKGAPKWAGWSTVLVGLAGSLLIGHYFSPESMHDRFGWQMNTRESRDWPYAIGTFTNVAIGCGWFFLTFLFAKKRPAEEKQRVDEFFQRMHTPVDFEQEQGVGSDNLQARVMGMLCLIYGGFILLLMLIPNPVGGRLAFAFCGLMVAGIGWALLAASRGKTARAEAAAREGAADLKSQI